MNREGYFKLFIYVSLVALGVSLYFADYLKIPKIYSLWDILISVLLLWIGFIIYGIAWYSLLKSRFSSIKLNDAIISTGLSIFGKYIPGKLWVILGQSEYIAENYEISRRETGVLSLNAQILVIWTGLVIGVIFLSLIDILNVYTQLGYVLIIFLSLVLYTPTLSKMIERIASKILKKNISIPVLSKKNIFISLPLFFSIWLVWCFSFYLLVESLTLANYSILTSGAFAVGGTLGILVFISPGGLGVREGILTGYLTLCGLQLEEALTISVASRLWFLTGEVFIFLISSILRFIDNRKVANIVREKT